MVRKCYDTILVGATHERSGIVRFGLGVLDEE